MSEQPIYGNAAADEADKDCSTSEEFGNLSVEDDAEGTTNPAELAESDQPRGKSARPVVSRRPCMTPAARTDGDGARARVGLPDISAPIGR